MLLPVEESYIVYSRCYFVLEHLLHMCPGCSSLCCRGCREVGMTPHIWWTCPKVRRFWICVHSLIHSVTLVNISKDAWVAFLNKPVDGIPRHMQTLFYFMFLAAKMAIATAQKSPMVDLALLKHKLTWIMLNEKIVSVLRDKQALFNKVWTYLQVPDA